MPIPVPSNLPRELLHAHAGLLVALEALRRARESLHDHVCAAEGDMEGCSLCRLRRSLTAASSRATRAYDTVEVASTSLVDQDTLDVAIVDVQEVLDGQRPLHLAGVRKTPQRAGRN